MQFPRTDDACIEGPADYAFTSHEVEGGDVGAAGQDHVGLRVSGHFLQEDVGRQLTRRIDAFIAAAR